MVRPTVFQTLPFQGDFLTATEPCVLLDGPWRSGKTHILIADALGECEKYPHNLIWFGRHEATKLRDSTIRDFHKLVPPSPKNWHEQRHDYTHHNGSVIMFRHMEDKTGLVNMDLGAVYIEQAEETQPDNFDFLLGRLSRQQSSRKMRPTCNPNGHDWLWQYFYPESPDYRPGYRVIRCPPADQNPHVPKDYVDNLRASLSPEMFEQYVLGSRDVMLGYRFFDAGALMQQAIHRPLAVGYFVDDFPKPDWRDQEGGAIRIYERYSDRDIYAMGLDIATGEGGSQCAGAMRNCTLNRVAAVVDANLRPDELAVQGWLLSRYYGQAVLAPERNGIGFSVLQSLRQLSGNIFTEQAVLDTGALSRTAPDGWLTDAKSRMELFAQLQREIAQRNLELKDRELIEQMKSITMSKRGRPEAEPGFRDDLVLALGISGMVRKLRPTLAQSSTVAKLPGEPIMVSGVHGEARRGAYGFGRPNGVKIMGR